MRTNFCTRDDEGTVVSICVHCIAQHRHPMTLIGPVVNFLQLAGTTGRQHLLHDIINHALVILTVHKYSTSNQITQTCWFV
jgi:hypothetical protein